MRGYTENVPIIVVGYDGRRVPLRGRERGVVSRPPVERGGAWARARRAPGIQLHPGLAAVLLWLGAWKAVELIGGLL